MSGNEDDANGRDDGDADNRAAIRISEIADPEVSATYSGLQSVLDKNSIVRVIERNQKLFDGLQLPSFANQIRSVVDTDYLPKIFSQIEAISFGIPQPRIAKILENSAASYDFLRGKNFDSILGASSISSVADQIRATVGVENIADLSTHFQSVIGSSTFEKFAEQARAVSNVSLGDFAAKYRSLVDGKSLADLLAQMPASNALGSMAGLEKRFRNSSAASWSTPEKGVVRGLDSTLSELFAELETRVLQAHTPPASPPPQHVSPIGISPTEMPSPQMAVSPQKGQSIKVLPTWLILVLIQALFVGTFVFVTNWEAAREGLVDINTRLPPTQSFKEIREFIRVHLAGKPGDLRIVTGSDVRLREGPNMSSDVLLELPKYARVVVVEKVNRTWLLVTYETDGYLIDGYVSTKFLKKVLRGRL